MSPLEQLRNWIIILAFLTVSVYFITVTLDYAIGDKVIRVQGPTQFYHASDLRVIEIRSSYRPTILTRKVNAFLDTTNVHVINMDFTISSCWITYIDYHP